MAANGGLWGNLADALSSAADTEAALDRGPTDELVLRLVEMARDLVNYLAENGGVLTVDQFSP